MDQQASELPLSGYEVLLCVTGGIACYKTADLCSKLVQLGCGVTVAMSNAAQEFIRPLTFQTLTGRQVYTSLWQSPEYYTSQHVAATELADLMVIAPATADILAKMAGGLADDLVSTLALAATGECRILAAPAMNTRMWNAPATRANLARLGQWGVQTVGPDQGRLACRTVGMGRMSEPAEILDRITELLKAAPPKRAGGAGA
jgi:phosphopantothenoylcysteine decarboxylase/phosphopantothenate--cysteine ligase